LRLAEPLGVSGTEAVLSVVRVQSFDNLEHWRNDFLHNASPSDPDNFPFVVLGNKADLEADRKVG
jgi:Ras-related protein Rab-7A